MKKNGADDLGDRKVSFGAFGIRFYFGSLFDSSDKD